LQTTDPHSASPGKPIPALFKGRHEALQDAFRRFDSRPCDRVRPARAPYYGLAPRLRTLSPDEGMHLLSREAPPRRATHPRSGALDPFTWWEDASHRLLQSTFDTSTHVTVRFPSRAAFAVRPAGVFHARRRRGSLSAPRPRVGARLTTHSRLRLYRSPMCPRAHRAPWSDLAAAFSTTCGGGRPASDAPFRLLVSCRQACRSRTLGPGLPRIRQDAK